MRNLWLLISKYNAFIFFIIFFSISLALIVKNNSFQRSAFLNSSNRLIGEAYSRINKFQSYLRLAKVNDSLAAENARLRSQMKNSFFDDSVATDTVRDTLTRQQYSYIIARVVNNSVNQKDNYLTINRGKKHGISKGMGVICSSGIVGIVKNVSDDFATVQSLLHSDTRISASIAENRAFGNLVWGEGSSNPQTAILNDIPNHIIVKKGQHIITSGFSVLFPAGLPIGKVMHDREPSGNHSQDIEIRLYTDFSTLDYVYVIRNFFALEKEQLETESKKDG